MLQSKPPTTNIAITAEMPIKTRRHIPVKTPRLELLFLRRAIDVNSFHKLALFVRLGLGLITPRLLHPRPRTKNHAV